MPAAAITGYIDVAQVVLYAFWAFFALLIIYLRREDKREGYPLERDLVAEMHSPGFGPAMPSPKSFLLRTGEIIYKPDGRVDRRAIRAVPTAPWPGAPYEPTGNPMLDGIGPSAYAERADVPDLTAEGHVKIVPLSADAHFHLEGLGPDPRGMVVVGADRVPAGVVTDVWVDRSEYIARYFEVELENGGRHILLPVNFSRIDAGRRSIRVKSILARHFADVPAHASPEQVTLLEEDRITAYYGGGHLYALPGRREPML